MNPTVNPGASLVVVADSVRARFFAAPSPTAPLEEVDSLLNPESRLHEGDIVESGHGRRAESGRLGSSMSGPTIAKRSMFGGQTAKRHRTEEFAARVCDRAADAVRERSAERVYIIAEPEFLGILRKRMDKPLQRRVAGELPKVLTSRAPEEIRAVLPRNL